MSGELIIPGSGREVVVRAAAAFGLSPDDLTGPLRHRRICRARYAAVWVMRRQFNADGLPKSYPQLALLLGGRDHSSLIYGERRCAEWMAAEPKYRATVEALLAGLAPVYVRPIEPEAVVPPPRCVADLPARQVKPGRELVDDDSGAVDRYNGSQRLLAAILRERPALRQAQGERGIAA